MFNLILIVPLAHAGLAAATSLSAWLNAGLLAWHLAKEGRLPKKMMILPSVLRTLIASLAMAAVLFWAIAQPWLLMPVDLLGRVIVVAMLVVLGLFSYGIALFAAGVRPRDIKHP